MFKFIDFIPAISSVIICIMAVYSVDIIFVRYILLAVLGFFTLSSIAIAFEVVKVVNNQSVNVSKARALNAQIKNPIKVFVIGVGVLAYGFITIFSVQNGMTLVTSIALFNLLLGIIIQFILRMYLADF